MELAEFDIERPGLESWTELPHITFIQRGSRALTKCSMRRVDIEKCLSYTLDERSDPGE